MFRGIYTAANAMQTKQNKIETISNNIANVDTTGYKKDVNITEAFSEKLLYKRQNNEGYLRAVPNRVKVDNKTLKDGNTQIDIELTRGYLQLEDKNGKGFYKSASLVRDNEGYLRTAYRDYNSKAITKFGAYLLDENGNKINTPQGEIAIDSIGNLTAGGNLIAKVVVPESRKSIGTINSGTLTDRIMINFAQGSQENTENPMHISLEGEGFLKVKLAANNQIKYSRGGAFTMDSNRVLKDYLGNSLISEQQNEIIAPQNSRSIEFKNDGSVFSLNDDGQREFLGKLALVNISNKEDMRKYGHNYMEMTNNSTAQEIPFEGKLLQGFLERSNVNSIDEMVNMIEMFRGFESDQKVIQAYDQIMQKAANELGKI